MTAHLSSELYPQARWYIDAGHRSLPGIRVRARLGDLLASEFDGLNTGDPEARDHVRTASTQMLDLGFDGIHFDFEPVRSGTAGYLAIHGHVRAIRCVRLGLGRTDRNRRAFGVALYVDFAVTEQGWSGYLRDRV